MVADGWGGWHMWYLGATTATAPPDRVPNPPYLTCYAQASSSGGPWSKRYDVVPFRPQPGTWYAHSASPGPVLPVAGDG